MVNRELLAEDEMREWSESVFILAVEGPRRRESSGSMFCSRYFSKETPHSRIILSLHPNISVICHFMRKPESLVYLRKGQQFSDI